ncbi:MAG: hypothetical protein PHV16_00485 [Candidatus Nanoarchaeia archaeon]|nr:hypothetical protein [Candidatus Nanoarchaeia archaeon]
MENTKTKILSIFMIMLILVIPFYTSSVFAQDEQTVVDKTPPSITIKDPPKEVTVPSLEIQGTTTEPVSIETNVNSNYHSTLPSNQDNTFMIQIALQQGENNIEIKATDAGGNSVVKNFEIYCDSQHPQIMYNNIHELSPSYIAKRKIRGTVNKPDMDITVYVDNKNKFEGKSDSEESGDGLYNFEVEILLERTVYIDGTGKVTTQEENTWQNPIKIVAIDKNGREATAEGTIIYTMCGYGSDWSVKTTKVTPEVIIPEHLIMGIAQFSFSANLSYLGNADTSKVIITSPPQITRYDLSQADMEEKKGLVFKERYYQEIFSGATPFCNEDNDKCYFVVNLNSWPYSREELQNVTFIKIPLRMDIYYKYEDINGNIIENTQRNCWDISIMVDKEIPVDKIPKNLLNKSINFLNKSITLIDKIKKPIDTAKQIAFVGCVVSWVVHFIKSVMVEFSCVIVKDNAIKALIDGQETCVAPATSTGEILDCTACLQNLKELRKIEEIRNWVCDRTFCPSVPTLDYHTQTYMDTIIDKNLCRETGQDSVKCEEEYKRAWDSAFVMLDEWERATAEEGEREESFFDKISEGLQFCKKSKEQKTQAITVGYGNDQKIYIIEDNGDVRIASNSLKIEDVEKENKIPEGVKVEEGKGEVYYIYETQEPLKVDEKGYFRYPIKEPIKFYENQKDGRIYVCPNDNLCNDDNEDIKMVSEKKFYINEKGEIQIWEDDTDKKYKPFTTEDNTYNTLYIDIKDNINIYSENTREVNIKKLPTSVQSARGIEGQNNYILDPTSDFIRSVQAVCLPAVSSWLNMWKQMLTAVKQCFESIMITGQGSTGVCKAVLTTYVCDIVYDVIRCTTDSFALGAGEEASAGLVGIAQKLSTAGRTVSDSISARYGQTGMYDVMFNQRKLIHSTCLWAFTGDWGQFDLDATLSTELGTMSIGSQGLLYPATRRFIGSNPLEYGRTTYVYHIGAGIIAGSEVNYKVYLKCSNDNSCPEGRCDCFYKGKEELYSIDAGSLKAGEIYNQEYYIQEPDRPVRYDKAVIEWSWTDNNGISQTETIVKDLQEKGEGTPEECKLDPSSGEFRCAYIIGKYGDARIVDILPSDGRDLDEEPYSRKEPINFDVIVHVESPDPTNPIPKYVKWSLRDSKNKMLYNDLYKIEKNGLSEEEVPNKKVEQLCCGSVSDAESTEKLEDYPELDLTISKTPNEDIQFAVTLKEDYYKIYDVTKENSEWKIKDPEVIDEGIYNKDYGIEYNGVTIKIDSDLSDDKEKAAVIVLRRRTTAQDCIEGEENMHFKVELLHSKTTEDHEGECCAKRIDIEDIKFTVDCNEYDNEDEEENEEDKEEQENDS